MPGRGLGREKKLRRGSEVRWSQWNVPLGRHPGRRMLGQVLAKSVRTRPGKFGAHGMIEGEREVARVFCSCSCSCFHEHQHEASAAGAPLASRHVLLWTDELDGTFGVRAVYSRAAGCILDRQDRPRAAAGEGGGRAPGRGCCLVPAGSDKSTCSGFSPEPCWRQKAKRLGCHQGLSVGLAALWRRAGEGCAIPD